MAGPDNSGLREMMLSHAQACMKRRILSLDRRIYGDRHPSVSQDLSNLAQVQEQLGFYTDAEKNERTSLDIVRAWYGNDHIEVALERPKSALWAQGTRSLRLLSICSVWSP